MRALTRTNAAVVSRAESAIWLYDRTANVTFCG